MDEQEELEPTRVSVAHLRLTRMYELLARLSVDWGDPQRAQQYREQADEHLRSAAGNEHRRKSSP